jgi:arylsulfatase B
VRHSSTRAGTPTRASLQSGRLPIHVLTQLADPCDGNGAIPRNMTGIAAKLKTAGYMTHHVGKVRLCCGWWRWWRFCCCCCLSRWWW